VEVAADAPGVTLLEGVKVAVAPAGKPLAASVTAFENAPFCGVTVMEYCAEPPGWMVCGAVVELMVKDGATAAVTVTVFVPVALL
jgi:hypothetical protein